MKRIILIIFCAIILSGCMAKANEKEVKLPVIMYHSVLGDPAKAGKYVVSPEVVEADIKYLYDNGYTAVTMQEVIDFVHNGKSLPEKPVVITFDDGMLNIYTYVVPILKKYNFKAVVSVVGEYADTAQVQKDPNPNYAYFSWDEINMLIDTGVVEVQNHTYAMHYISPRKGAGKMKNESKEEYVYILKSDLIKMQEALNFHCGIIPTTFVYPMGIISADSLDAVKEVGFRASLSCIEKVNTITQDSECLYQLGRFNRPSGISTYEFMKKALGTE